MSNPYELRMEAERLIGMDRVPTEVLQDIIERYGEKSGARTVRQVAENLARLFSVDTRLIEEDYNEPPTDTTPYEGRAVAFAFEADGLQIRVLVEDVTIDGERRSYVYEGIE